MSGNIYRNFLAATLAGVVVLAPAAPAFAQQDRQASPAPATQPTGQAALHLVRESNPNYTSGKPFLPNPLRSYTPPNIPGPVLVNSPRIEQMIQDKQLKISVEDAVELALENNLDIAIERYSPWLAEANVLHTLGGGTSRGSFLPLGNIFIPSFDPILASSISLDSRSFPVNNPQLAGAGTLAGTFAELHTHAMVADVSYLQGFHTGTSYSVSFDNTRASSTSLSNFFSPSVATTLTIAASQPLLNGFGVLPNEHIIRVARMNTNLANEALEQQVITSITAVENAYWELAFARGNVDVARQEVALANKLYSDNKRQVEVGTLAPLELVRAEAQVATANQALILAQTTQLQDQLALLNLITKDPSAPALRDVEIVTIDSAAVPPPEVEKIPLTDAIREADSKRPDVKQALTALAADDVNVRATKNALLPQLTVSAFYTAQGLGGNRPGAVPPIVGGLGTAWGDAFTGAYPEYNAQLTLTVPIRNRQAQADNVTALLDQRQDQTRYQQVLNNAAIDVQNAQILLEQARVTLDAAVKTRDLDQQTLDAEEKKYQLGTSTLFNIVSDQNTLAGASSAEVRARINLEQAKVNFDRAMGRTMEVFNVTISDVKSAHPTRTSLIPGTSATGALFIDPRRSSPSGLSAPEAHSDAGNSR